VSKLGIVIEGFNEGDKFKRCLESLENQNCLVVYVDSGSTDGSLELARAHKLSIVNLDVSITPFNCARARNAGFDRLFELDPSIEYVQFIDADCEMDIAWLQYAEQCFETDDTLGVICGRLREKYRNLSIYARLCDMEWDTAVGDVDACGGIAMMRASIFKSVGGFNVNLRAGEEIELCSRIKESGYRIVRVKEEMGLHDASIVNFSQWAGRISKYGFATAESISRGLGDRQKHRYVFRALLWAGVMPVIALSGLVIGFWDTIFLIVPILVVCLYVVLVLRIYTRRRKHGDEVSDSWFYAFFCIVGKWPELRGMMRFWRTIF
jgi:GT2 family glycosyltransferase